MRKAFLPLIGLLTVIFFDRLVDYALSQGLWAVIAIPLTVMVVLACLSGLCGYTASLPLAISLAATLAGIVWAIWSTEMLVWETPIKDLVWPIAEGLFYAILVTGWFLVLLPFLWQRLEKLILKPAIQQRAQELQFDSSEGERG